MDKADDVGKCLAMFQMSDRAKKIYEKGFKKKSGVIEIYRNLQIEEILPLIVDSEVKLPLFDIPWNLVANKLITRSYDDCRNTWITHIYPLITNTKRNYSREDEIGFLQGIIS